MTVAERSIAERSIAKLFVFQCYSLVAQLINTEWQFKYSPRDLIPTCFPKGFEKHSDNPSYLTLFPGKPENTVHI
ncbi:hypothetical protein N9B37_01145, partial [bacterium]|nr:hypothetical protein [bacterium]